LANDLAQYRDELCQLDRRLSGLYAAKGPRFAALRIELQDRRRWLLDGIERCTAAGVAVMFPDGL
jgi:hypothetical protein